MVNALIFNVPYVEVYWDQGIAYILNGAAIVTWMRLIVRKIDLIKAKSVVPIFVFIGVVCIGLGIVLTMALVFA